MRRFFVEDLSAAQKTVEISGDEFVHLKKVLRLSVGDDVAIFNGTGLELIGTIETMGKSNAIVRVASTSLNVGEEEREIVLLQGLLKGDKPELVIQKATELGVNQILFYNAERSVALISEKKTDNRISRWRKTAIEAAKQCGRTIVPEISITDFNKALSTKPDYLRLVVWENEKKISLNTALKNSKTAKGAVVLVGPEGGLTDVEVKNAAAHGFICASLGKRILRAETAAIAAIAMLRFAFDETEPA